MRVMIDLIKYDRLLNDGICNHITLSWITGLLNGTLEQLIITSLCTFSLWVVGDYRTT